MAGIDPSKVNTALLQQAGVRTTSRNPFAIGNQNAAAPFTYQKYNLETGRLEGSHLYNDPRMAPMRRLFDDPQAAAAIQQLTQYGEGSRQGRAAMDVLKRRQEALGVKLPSGWSFGVTPQGQLGFRQRDIVGDYVAPLALYGTIGLLGAGIGSAALGGSGTATPGLSAGVQAADIPVTGAGIGTGVGSGTGLGTTAGGLNVLTGTGVTGVAAPTGISAGVPVAAGGSAAGGSGIGALGGGAFKGVTFGATGGAPTAATAGTTAATAGTAAAAGGGWGKILLNLGANIAQSYIGARAEKKAAGQQQAASQQAAAAYAPFVAGGTQAFNTLAGLAGLGGGGGMGAPASLSASQAPMPVSTRGGGPPPEARQTLASFGGGRMGAPGDPTAQTQPSSFGGDSVMMIAPNGFQKPVPRAEVDYWTQRGARLAGGM